jgi:hypothetical protein
MCQVLFLNTWLDCPEVIKKRHQAMQDKISEARVYFFYKLKEEGNTESKAIYLYMIWIQQNRKRLKVLDQA